MEGPIVFGTVEVTLAFRNRFCDLVPERHDGRVASTEVLPCGLINRGNLSFLNATVQALLTCPPFFQILQELRKSEASMVEFPCLAAFYELVNEVGVTKKKKFLAIGTPFYPSMFEPVLKLFTPDISPPGITPREEDAQKFLSFVMDQMVKELLKLEGKSRHEGVESAAEGGEDRLSSVFKGELCSAVKTKGKNTFPPATGSFHLLHLDISRKDVTELEAALYYFFEKDTGISGMPKIAANAVKIKKLPEIMIIHLERLPAGGTKQDKALKFPLKLILNRYTSVKQEANYQLISTIRHHGKEASNGHYTADALYLVGDTKERKQQWVRFDDASVTAIGPGEVQHSQAYILFYRKI